MALAASRSDPPVWEEVVRASKNSRMNRGEQGAESFAVGPSGGSEQDWRAIVEPRCRQPVDPGSNGPYRVVGHTIDDIRRTVSLRPIRSREDSS